MRLPILFIAMAGVLLCGCSHGDSNSLPEDRAGQQEYAGQSTTGSVSGIDENEGRVADSDDWPRLYGPHGNCLCTEDGLQLDWKKNHPPILWSAEIGTGYSAPVIVDEQLILQHRLQDEEVVTCFDGGSGDIEWECRYPTAYECDYSNYSSGPYSTPVIGDDVVYVMSAEGIFRMLSLVDGEVIRKRDLSREYGVPTLGYSVGHTPLLLDDRLIVNLGGTKPESGVLAIDAATGDTIWSGVTIHATRPYGSYVTPIAATIHGNELVFVVTSESVVCLQSADGTDLWSIPFGTESRDTPNSTTPVIQDDLLFVSMFRAGAFCLRINPDGSYTELWRNRRSIESCYNPLTCVDGYVYGWHSFDKTLRCVELLTGDVQWKQRTVFQRGNHIAVNDRLIVLGELGHLGSVKISPNAAEVMSESELPVLESPCFTMPALSCGRLYARNESRLVCFDLAADE